MTLEQALRAAAARGCKAFTVWPAPGGWQCNVQNSDGGWACVTNTDPAAGLLAACDRRLGAPVVSEKPNDTSTQDIFG